MKSYKTVNIKKVGTGNPLTDYWIVESSVLKNVKRRFFSEVDAYEFADYYEEVAQSAYA